MPTKKVTCPKRNPVLLTVYVERPKRSTHSHQHHPYIHHTIRRDVIHYRSGADGQGYISRRAELLQYSQRLRLSARPAAPASKPYYQNQNQNQTKSSQPAKIVAVRRKLKTSKAPSKSDNWKMPSVFGLCTSPQAKKERKPRKKRSGSTSNKIKSVIESLKGQKKQGFFSRLFSPSSKRK